MKRDSSGTQIESYIYDQRRLIEQINTGSDNSSFSYDPNAYRIGKITPTQTNQYLLEGEHLESTYDASNQLKASYLRGVVVDEIINGFERDTDGKLVNRSFHHDQVNSVIATTDHTGAATQTNTYGPFGQSLGTTGSDSNALMYTGRENDANGLYYYRARYYDPFAGRFLSEDPIGFEAGVNFYAYVGNNPVRFGDPGGLEKQVTLSLSGTIFAQNPDGTPLMTIRNLSTGDVTHVEAIHGSGSVGVGISSFGDSIWDTQVFFETRSTTLSEGAGYFAGLGFSVDGSSTEGPLPSESTSVSDRFEANAGLVASIGVSYEKSEGELSGVSLTGGKFGVGIGAHHADGTSETTRYASPTLGEYYDSLFGDNSGSAASGGFVLYPGAINSSQIQSVYSK